MQGACPLALQSRELGYSHVIWQGEEPIVHRDLKPLNLLLLLVSNFDPMTAWSRCKGSRKPQNGFKDEARRTQDSRSWNLKDDEPWLSFDLQELEKDDEAPASSYMH